MPLINCKIGLELNWIEVCILSSAVESAKCKIRDVTLHVPIVTLSIKDNVNLTKQLSNRLKRSAYWNSYQTIPAKVINKGTNVYELLGASFQRIKTLFVLAHVIDAGAANNETGMKNNRKYFLPKVKNENYNVLINGKKFYDQPINDLIKQYDEVKSVNRTRWWKYFRILITLCIFQRQLETNHSWSKQKKALVADPRVIKQKVFQGVAEGPDKTKIRLYAIFEKSKETVLKFYKGPAKVL